MLQQMRRVLARFWGSPGRARKQTRSTEARARFWAAVREGEREAERDSLSARSMGAERLEIRRRQAE